MKIRSFILFNFIFLTYVCAQTFNTSSITSDLDYTQKILPVDLDSDGEVDVLYASEQGDLLGVLKNDGLETFTNLEISIFSARFSEYSIVRCGIFFSCWNNLTC